MDGFGNGRPLRARAKRTLAAKFLHEFDRQGQAVADGKRVKARVVTCSRHEERENDKPCLLSAALQDEITPNCLLRVVSKQHAGLHFFARAHSENFDKSVRGISIFRMLADKLRITDKEVELHEVKEEEAKLDEVVLIISERYLSKRDIWHAHLAMMQHGGQLLYYSYDHNLRQHMPSSRVEQLIGGPEHGPVSCGQVTADTNVTFKSGSSNMFVLIQVTSELWTYSLSGRPYWDVMLDCFAQLLERSLKVSGSNGSGHYLHMVLYARVKSRSRRSSLFSASPPGDQDNTSPMADNLPLTRNPCHPLPRPRRAIQTEHEDFYDVFWEGFAKNMPPAQHLISRVRQVFIGLQEQSFANSGHCMHTEPRMGTGTSDWKGIRVADISEASRGNTLECINMVLNHYDQHHLDRLLKITGQPIVLLTAGNGLVYSSSCELYELTHQRFTTAGPTGFHMICVRDPPLHEVPWITWPNGPAPYGVEIDRGSEPGSPVSTSQMGARISAPPPVSPPWVDVHFYREVTFCQCSPEQGWIRSCLLPLESLQSPASGVPPVGYVPDWEDATCNLEPPYFANRRARADSFSSDCKTGPCKPNFVTADLWEALRWVRLSSYYQQSSQLEDGGGRRKHYWTEYLVEPNRFNDASIQFASDEASLVHEQMAIMNDLIGLRLDVFPQIHLGVHNKVQDRVERSISASRDIGRIRDKDLAEPISDPWFMQGNLIPEKLHSLVLRAANGMQWTLDPCGTGLNVAFKSQGIYRRAPELTHRYTGFFVRRHLVRGCTSDDREGSIGAISRESDTFWVPSRCVFHLPMQLEWNKLDTIIAGNLDMPAALPYPVQRSSPKTSATHDRCSGWKLNRAVKQHFFVLVPQECKEHSHEGLFAECVRVLGGGIDTGTDPFQTLEGHQEVQDTLTEMRQRSIERFSALKRNLEQLCFGSKSSNGADRGDTGPGLDIAHELDATSYEVKCNSSTVYIRDTSIASAFKYSRDWFELFYDSSFVPPKFFHLVMQWIVCSSVHLVNFLARLSQLAKDHGFFLVRVPIAQLFPQPAPPWVWGDDRETNLDRPTFYPRRRIPFPAGMNVETRRQLNAKLLSAWVQAPLNFVFFFSSPTKDFKCVATPDTEAVQPQADHQVFQRLKGWVLSEPEGLCLIALREENVYWYENWLLFSDLRDFRMMGQRLQRIDELRHQFYTVSEEIISDTAVNHGLEYCIGDPAERLQRSSLGSDAQLPRERGPTEQSGGGWGISPWSPRQQGSESSSPQCSDSESIKHPAQHAAGCGEGTDSAEDLEKI